MTGNERAVSLTEEAVAEIRRREFPSCEDAAHLKASGGSPMCRSAYEAQANYLRQMCFEGDLYYSDYLADLDRGRERIAAYLGAAPEEIGYTVNSSSAAALAADLLVRAGVRRVYHPVSEFPTSVHALTHRGLTPIPAGDPGFNDTAEQWLDAAAAHLRANPANGRCALIASHVCFLNGETLDIGRAAAFCRENGLLFVLNATQSFGALSIDVADGVDMAFATGLKWAFAGYGAGFLYVRQSLVDEIGLGAGTGWLSVTDPYRMDNRNTASVQVARSLDAGGGMPHFGPLLGLNGALGMVETIGNGDIRAGIRAVEGRLLENASYLRSALGDAGHRLLGGSGRTARSGIVTVAAAGAQAAVQRLAERKILVSFRTLPSGDRAPLIRFGVHFFNTKKELDSALSLL